MQKWFVGVSYDQYNNQFFQITYKPLNLAYRVAVPICRVGWCMNWKDIRQTIKQGVKEIRGLK